MNNLSLMQETAALGGYTVGSSGTDLTNKQRAQRRVNQVKADIISRYGGKWPANYREGWLALAALYSDGTATFTNGSFTVTGSSTAWTSDMKGRKILGPDNAYYKIASVVSATSLLLTQPFQGTTSSDATYQIWKDEYRICPDALAIGGFVNYNTVERATESWPANMKGSYPYPTSVEEPRVYTVLGRANTDTVSTGTVTGTINTFTLTGSGTSWLTGSTPIEPGFQITISGYTYTVKCVNSDTELELYQMLVQGAVSLTYSAVGKNAIVIRFQHPTAQKIVNYWYFAKDCPFVNDSDEDWIAQEYPRVIISGVQYFDYLDKNDVPRAVNSATFYEDAIKNMRVAVEAMYTGIRTIGLSIPDEARD